MLFSFWTPFQIGLTDLEVTLPMTQDWAVFYKGQASEAKTSRHTGKHDLLIHLN